jgi:hypothetical protein
MEVKDLLSGKSMEFGNHFTSFMVVMAVLHRSASFRA